MEKLGISEETARKKVEKISSIEKIKSNVEKKTGDIIRKAGLSGIKVDRIKIYAFMICAMLSSVAAMIHAAQISQGGPNEGQGYELNAVAACAIGGTSLAGGKGTVFGTLIGALILGMLDNVLGLKGVNSNLQLMVKGFLIIIAVFMQADKVSD